MSVSLKVCLLVPCVAFAGPLSAAEDELEGLGVWYAEWLTRSHGDTEMLKAAICLMRR